MTSCRSASTACGSASPSGRPACVPVRRCWIWPAAPAIWRRNSWGRSGQPARGARARSKPGGRLLVLEFSKPVLPGLNAVYDAYSFHLLPKLGKLIANDEDSYRYLVESIRVHLPSSVAAFDCLLEYAATVYSID